MEPITPDPPGQRPRERLSRRTWALATLLLTVAMIAVAGSTRRRVARSVHELDRSQGELLLAAARETLRNLPGPPVDQIVAPFLARHARDGLLGIAFFGSDGRMLAHAGAASDPRPGSLPVRRTEPPPIAIREGRIRMYGYFRPVSDSGGVRRWAVARGGEAGAMNPSVIMIEFDPVLSRDLLSDADGTFALAALTGAALVALTVLFWRLSGQTEEARQQREQERRLAMLGEMSAVLAHEIRNPLASLKGNAQLLARRLQSGGTESRKAELIVTEAERLQTLTSDLLDFAGSGPVDRQPVDPCELLSLCVQEVGASNFTVDCRDAPRTWPLDSRRLRQAILNVLRNAVQASPPGARAEVSLRVEGGALVIAVRDHGEGIPPGDPERLFAPFHTTRITGTGLGLAVARRIAQQHGGTIEAANLGDGALFRITLAAPAGNGHGGHTLD